MEYIIGFIIGWIGGYVTCHHYGYKVLIHWTDIKIAFKTGIRKWIKR